MNYLTSLWSPKLQTTSPQYRLTYIPYTIYSILIYCLWNSSCLCEFPYTHDKFDFLLLICLMSFNYLISQKNIRERGRIVPLLNTSEISGMQLPNWVASWSCQVPAILKRFPDLHSGMQLNCFKMFDLHKDFFKTLLGGTKAAFSLELILLH